MINFRTLTRYIAGSCLLPYILLLPALLEAANLPTPGKRYSVQAADGRFIGCQGDDQLTLVGRGRAAILEIQRVNGNKYVLKSSSCGFFSTHASLREVEIDDAGEGKVSIRVATGDYVSANLESGVLDFRSHVNSWERFLFISSDHIEGLPEPGKRYFIRALDGSYVGCIERGKFELTGIDSATLFEIVKGRENRVGIKSESCGYLRATPDRKIFSAKRMQSWEEFTFEHSTADGVNVRSTHNTFISTNFKTKRLDLQDTALSWEKLSFVEYDIKPYSEEDESHRTSGELPNFAEMGVDNFDPNHVMTELDNIVDELNASAYKVDIAGLMSVLTDRDVVVLWIPIGRSQSYDFGHVAIATKNSWLSMYYSPTKDEVWYERSDRDIEKRFGRAFDEGTLELQVIRLRPKYSERVPALDRSIAQFKQKIDASKLSKKDAMTYSTGSGLASHHYRTNLLQIFGIVGLGAGVAVCGGIACGAMTLPACLGGVALAKLTAPVGAATGVLTNPYAQAILGHAARKILFNVGTAAAIACGAAAKITAETMDENYRFTNCALAVSHVCESLDPLFCTDKPTTPFGVLEKVRQSCHRIADLVLSNRGLYHIKKYRDLSAYFRNFDKINTTSSHKKRI